MAGNSDAETDRERKEGEREGVAEEALRYADVTPRSEANLGTVEWTTSYLYVVWYTYCNQG
jgi:hypothetical protein